MPIISTYIGGAGVGKTTTLLNTMAELIEKRYPDPRSIGFVSFTRAARQEAASRAADRFNIRVSELERDGWFRTMHSVCYRLLGVGDRLLVPGRETQNWVRDVVQYEVAGTGEVNPETDSTGRQEQATPADMALEMWCYARNAMVPLDVVHSRAWSLSAFTPEIAECRKIADRYEQAKRLHNRVDFTDLLAQFAGVSFSAKHGPSDVPPLGEIPEVPVWFLDEAQDNSALIDRAARRLTSNAELVYLSGDPFQCQPRGTPVLTSQGYKSIEDLDPGSDGLIAFNQGEGCFAGASGGVKFSVASRLVPSTELFLVEMEDGTVHTATTDHKWICRISIPDTFGTYLMKKGTRWRVGSVQMMNRGKKSKKNSDFRLNNRVAQEQAEACWLLKVSTTDREARMYEQIVSYKYGIPQTTFRPPCGRTNLDKGFIEAIFTALGDLTPNAVRCLEDHAMLIDRPLLEKGVHQKHGTECSRTMHTCNLIPGMCLLPKMNPSGFADGRRDRKNGVIRPELSAKRTVSSRLLWVAVKSVTRLSPGKMVEVFSLNVEKHHTYVTTNGYVTHNSIHGWAGADHHLFQNWNRDRVKILDQSYRCPEEILSLGEACLKPCSDYWDRKIKPRPKHENDLYKMSQTETRSKTKRTFSEEKSQGLLYTAGPNEWLQALDPRDSWLLLARTNFQARRLMAMVKSLGIPWRPLKGNGGWNAPVRNAACEALWSLEEGVPIDFDLWSAVLKQIPTRSQGNELVARGVKARWEKGGFDDQIGRMPLPEDMVEWGATEYMLSEIRAGAWGAWVDNGSEFRAVGRRYGLSAAMCREDARTRGGALAGIRIGTCHSAKGMEADNVVLLTTSSAPVARSAALDSQGADEEARVAYVGVTRARERLFVCNEKCQHKMPVPLAGEVR